MTALQNDSNNVQWNATHISTENQNLNFTLLINLENYICINAKEQCIKSYRFQLYTYYKLANRINKHNIQIKNKMILINPFIFLAFSQHII